MKPNSKQNKKSDLRNAIDTVLSELGTSMVYDENSLSSFEYDNVDYLLFMDEADGVYSIMEYVVGLNDNLTEQDFNLALESIKEDYPDYDGDWNEGRCYLSSPLFILPPTGKIDKEFFVKIVKEFFEVWTIIIADVCFMTDSSIWDIKEEEQQ